MATPGLVIVGVGLVQAFAGVGLQAIVFGAVAGFLLSMMLSTAPWCCASADDPGSD
jgi:hypothetical protein